jgi:crotonobetainyl-CoA:carnitine CoA-transferase CaiB-like acyl-CoA transferase
MTEAIDGGALEGVRVLEVGGEIGAWCGKLLADMGATVVKVEPPGGDRTRSYEPFYQDEPGPERSLYFWHYNTSKKSLTLDLDAEAGLDLFRRLVAGADVVLDSHQPGHLADLGIGYEELRKVRPDLVMAAVSPFGQDGPYANYAMTDLTALAFGGPAWSCGYDDHDVPPVRGGGNQGYHTASHFAAIGILIALVHRQQTGVGQFLDVNMHAALNVTTEAGSYTYLVTQENVKRQTGRHASVRQTPPSQILGPGGRYLNVGFPARTEEQWIQLLAWLEDEGVVGDLQEYLSPPSRQALQAGDEAALEQLRKVSGAITAMAQDKDPYELFREAQTRGFQWGIVNAPEDVMEDPHFQARGFAVEVEHPELGASFRYPGAPYKLTRGGWAIRRRAPLLGEDTESVLGELGVSAGEVASLRASGVV